MGLGYLAGGLGYLGQHAVDFAVEQGLENLFFAFVVATRPVEMLGWPNLTLPVGLGYGCGWPGKVLEFSACFIRITS